MEADDWLEIVQWVNDRFTPGWTIDKATAYGVDLRDYLAEDVWDALYRLYDRGLEYPPNGSQLTAETTVVVRERMERARREAAGLPETTDQDLGWENWRASLGYEGLSLDEAFRQRHAELFPRGCPYPGCDVCGNRVVDVASTLV